MFCPSIRVPLFADLFTCSIVVEVIAIKIFQEIVHGKDQLFCCVFLFLSGMSAVCRHAEPAHPGDLLVLGGGIGEFWEGDAL